jgi:prevent-host-death family protein
MAQVFQVQEAKNRFSELVDLCLKEGPQTVTRYGKPVVQIVPIHSTRTDSRSIPASGILALRGTGAHLWGEHSKQSIDALRNEWE